VLQLGAPWRYLLSGVTLRVAVSVTDAVAEMAVALGYVAITVCIVEFARGRSLLNWAAPLGRMAFSNYIGQSLFFGWIFFGYGLGLFGIMSIGRAAVIGLSLYVLQVLYSRWWLGRFRYGPVEWLWRSLMYGNWQPMLRPTHTNVPAPT